MAFEESESAAEELWEDARAVNDDMMMMVVVLRRSARARDDDDDERTSLGQDDKSTKL